MKEISHGLPNHPFFIIAQPPSVAAPTVRQVDKDYVRPLFTLKDPKTEVSIQAELHDVWAFNINEIDAMNAFSKSVYGIEAPQLKNILLKRYPEIAQTQKVHFLLLKKL